MRKNAEQRNLTGVCIFNPGFSMVYVEGAAKFIRKYKRLMLHRIAWTEAARERGEEDVELDDDDDGGGGGEEGGGEKARAREEWGERGRGAGDWGLVDPALDART